MFRALTISFMALALSGCSSAGSASDQPAAATPEAGIDSSADTGPDSDGAWDGTADQAVESAVDTGAQSDADGSAAPDGGDAEDAADATLPVMPTQSMLIGYNEAWFNTGYGSDLTTNFDLQAVEKTFDAILAGGGHIVRLWLFEARQGFKIGAGVPQTEGLDPGMLVNLGQVLDAARARGLWVYLTALEGNEMQKIPGLKDYYWNLLNNKYGEGDAYNDNVLTPLLALLDQHQDVIYGLDLMNEIEAPRSVPLWTDPYDGPRAFIKRTTAFIKSKSPWIRVTSTAGWTNSQYDISGGFFSGLGLDFYDLHMYSDNGSYAGATAVCDKAAADGVTVILGEFGQKNDTLVDDTLQYNVTAAFLATAKSMCFKAALPWRWDYGLSVWDFVRQDGTPRPAVSVVQQYGALP